LKLAAKREKGMGEYRTENFCVSRNQFAIRGKWYIPVGDNRIFPTVIISHGLGSNMGFMERYAEIFVECGYAAAVFDFCGSGSGSSDGDSKEMTIFTEKMDLECVVDYARSLPFVDKKEVILAGSSQGGLVSALAAAYMPSVIQKLILYYPAFCIPDDAHRMPDVFSTLGTSLGISLGACYVTEAQSIDLNDAYAYDKPVLICHGTADQVVDFSYAINAAKAYPNARLEEIQGGDHGFHACGFEQAKTATIQFLK
jgi:hypothetical protein